MQFQFFMVKAIVLGTTVWSRKKTLKGKQGRVLSMTGAGHNRRFNVRWADATESTESSRSLAVAGDVIAPSAGTTNFSSESSCSSSDASDDEPDPSERYIILVLTLYPILIVMLAFKAC